MTDRPPRSPSQPPRRRMLDNPPMVEQLERTRAARTVGWLVAAAAIVVGLSRAGRDAFKGL
jgi:hypothetical protein